MILKKMEGSFVISFLLLHLPLLLAATIKGNNANLTIAHEDEKSNLDEKRRGGAIC